MVESTFKDLLKDLEAIRIWSMNTETDCRILDLIEAILNRLILLEIEK